MIKNRDIIIIGIQAWDIEIGSNCKNIAAELSKHNRVLYVNSPLDRMSLIKGKHSPRVQKIKSIIAGKEEAIEKVDKQLWAFNPRTKIEPINRLPSNGLFDWLNKINTKRFAKEINKAIEELGFEDCILFNDSSMFMGLHIKDYLNCSSYIYYIRDNLVHSPFPYWNTHGRRIEPQTIKKADLVVTNSLYYLEYAAEYNPNSFMVGQGCDTSMFDDETQDIIKAEDLNGINNPIIGYVGNIAEIRLDIDLLIYMADKKPDWQIVLVGPEDDAFKASDLHNKSNVHFLGSKPSDTLQNYIKGFDVCINPQILNITTIGNYPRKIDEYLAMGKPTVATKTKAMVYFEDHTYLAEDNEDYIRLIDLALTENSDELKQKRRLFALNHSWENNVEEISKAYYSVFK